MSEWIKISERLPDPFCGKDPVLAVIKTMWNIAPYVDAVIFLKNFKHPEGKFKSVTTRTMAGDDLYFDIDDVLYWKPWPEPPKGE